MDIPVVRRPKSDVDNLEAYSEEMYYCMYERSSVRRSLTWHN